MTVEKQKVLWALHVLDYAIQHHYETREIPNPPQEYVEKSLMLIEEYIEKLEKTANAVQ